MRVFSVRACLVMLGLAAAVRALAASASLLILHTNDLHNHVRTGPGGQGGLPWISGYAKSVRAERSDVLILDAGDVTEKGDLVAYKTDGAITYEAMRRAGYDFVTLGNHDWDAQLKRARGYEKLLGQPIVCLNVLNPDGTPAFAPSRVFTVGALKVGVIGATVTQKQNCLNFEDTGRAIAREAARLRTGVHLVVAVCHEGSASCMTWAKMAPEVDVFVSGHTHELLPHPLIVPETGARIVQTGSYARQIGRLDLVVDLETKKITSARDEMVALKHDTIPVDRDLLAWVQAREQAICPEAARVLLENPDHLTAPEVGWLAAEALRRAAKADIGFCHAGQIVRSPLYPGTLDVNGVFLTGGELGHAIVTTELSGAEIEAYLEALARADKVLTNWSGFRATRSADGRFQTDLAADRRYRVVLPKREWTTRFMANVERAKTGANASIASPLLQRTFAAEASKATFTSAVTDYVVTVHQAGETLKHRASALIAAGKGGS